VCEELKARYEKRKSDRSVVFGEAWYALPQVRITSEKEVVMTVELAPKVINLLTTLNEEVAEFRKRATDVIYPRGRLGNFETKLNEDTYYMLYRPAGNDVEVYDYDIEDPDMKYCDPPVDEDDPGS
jgi:hypothetical protein